MTETSATDLLSKPSNWAAIAARACFSAAVLLIPFRLRVELWSRSFLPVYTDYTDFLLFASDVAVLAMLVMWAISLVMTPRRIRLGPRHIWIPLVGLLLAAWISVSSSFDPLLSVYHAIRLSVLFWFYVFIVNEIPSLSWVTIPVGVQAIIQAVVALGQFLAQRSLGLAWLGEQTLNPAAPGTSVVSANGERLLRAYGLADHPNILGGCLAFALVLLLLPILRKPGYRPIHAAFVLASAALIATFSRAAWIAFMGGAAVIVIAELLHRRVQALRNVLLLGVVAAVLPVSMILAYSPYFGVRLGSGGSFTAATAEQQSWGERFILIRDAMPILLDHPLTGVGIGASPLAMRAYYPRFNLNYEPPHWTLFDAALETGVIGGLFYLALLLFPLIAFVHRWRSLAAQPAAVVSLALLISLTLVGFFDYYPWLLQPGRLWQWLAWGIWGIVWNVKTPLAQRPVPSPV